ncbi:MAG: hypothetical protein BroJett012_08060 [Betaproteobacteria bacterium]|nr:MAG: hypothetical protein BroJett012_08060 [Betaproteobacteria bacterium]
MAHPSDLTDSGQPPGHLYGPPPPHIGFWYGGRLLGETRGHPSSVEAAREKLRRQIDLLQPGPDGRADQIRLISATAVLYCGALKRALVN